MRPRDENQQRIYRKSSNMPWWQNACVRAYICDLFIVYVCAQFIEIYRGVYECVFFRLAFVCSVVLCHFFCCERVLSIVVSFAMRLTAWIFGWKDRKRHTHKNRENVSYLPSFSMLFAKYGENIQILCVPRHNVYFAAILFTSMHLVGENAGGASTIDSITNPKPYPTRNIKLSNSTSIWAECKARSMKTFDCCIIYSAEMLIRFVTHCLSYIP